MSFSRIDLLKSVLPDSDQLDTAIQHVLGNASQIASDDAPPALLQNVRFANALAELTDDRKDLVKRFLDDPEIHSIRDVALSYNDEKLAKLLDAEQHGPNIARVQSESASSEPEVAGRSLDHETHGEEFSSTTVADVRSLQHKIFNREPTAVLRRMIADGDIPLSTPKAPHPRPAKQSEDANLDGFLKAGVLKFFANKPHFDIRQTSIISAITEPGSLDGVHESTKSDVIVQLKRIQTTQCLTYAPEALPHLFQANLFSAFQVSSIPRSNFIEHFGKVLDESVAKQIHAHATNVVIRNDHALTTLLQTVRGTGLAAIDGKETRAQRTERILAQTAALPDQVDLDKLFGSLDYCACDDCNSVTSPAAYFVEILQFLRNNNLDPDGKFPNTGQNGYKGTPLEKLLRRRPDLANLELSCANTNTVLPYIDLANEVMESFVVHLDLFRTDTDNPKQSEIDVFNVDPDGEGIGGSSAELLAKPQNTNFEAYCILKSAVFPAANLPYNQPIQVIRLFLGFLGSSRAELQSIFREAYSPPTNTIVDTMSKWLPDTDSTSFSASSPIKSSSSYSTSSSEDSSEEYDDTGGPTSTLLSQELQSELVTIHELVLQRAKDAENLQLTQDEYIIITKQAFWPKRYFDIRHGTTYTPKVYREKIGFKPTYQYWGADYSSNGKMLSLDESQSKGLTFVKAQFLRRSGITYEDLVALLRTEFINPNLPHGKALVIMESFRFSYLFLKSLVHVGEKSHKSKFKTIIRFLEDPGSIGVIGDVIKVIMQNFSPSDLTSVDECKQHKTGGCKCKENAVIRDWIYKNFDKVGELIVLESGEGPMLPFEADLVVLPLPPAPRPGTAALLPSGLDVPQKPPTLNQHATPSPPQLPPPSNVAQLAGHLYRDGRILDLHGNLLGRVILFGLVLVPDWTEWATKYGSISVAFRRTDGKGVPDPEDPSQEDQYDAWISPASSIIRDQVERILSFSSQQDDCNIDNVRLRHLDGSSLTEKEYDRLHRFLRLWKKLGWTMQELDGALRGLGDVPEAEFTAAGPLPPGTSAGTSIGSDWQDVDWSDFKDTCDTGNCGKDTCKRCSRGLDSSSSSKILNGAEKTKRKAKMVSTITPGFIHQIQAVQKLVTLTGLSVLQLLSFWTTIDTYSPDSLYAQLFLTHNILGTDPIFKADGNGNYLSATSSPRIADHLPVLRAAFGLDAEGLAKVLEVSNIKDGLLTLENVSMIYRFSLLATVLSIGPANLSNVVGLFTSPWKSATVALNMMMIWNKMGAAGFNLQQLGYIVKGTDDQLHPIGPSQTSILRTTKTIYDGLKAIEVQNPDFSDILLATSSEVLTRLQVMFNSAAASQIMSFLEGSMIFSTNAPKDAQIKIPPELVAKVKYTGDDDAELQITGQLTPDESVKVKSLSSNPKWTEAVDRLHKQALNFFNVTLQVIFPDPKSAKDALVSGDVLPSTDPTVSVNETGPVKRFYFLKQYMPFVRKKQAVQLIGDNMASAFSISSEITNELLATILVSSGAKPRGALAALEAIKDEPAEVGAGWDGFLYPSSSDSYAISCRSLKDDNQPPPIILDGQSITFPVQQDDPTNIWFTKDIRLTGGRLYQLQVQGQSANLLQWKTARSPPATIPSSALLPKFSVAGVSDIFVKLFKASLLVNTFNLTFDEVGYLQQHGSDFGSFDFNLVTLSAWVRLADYISLRQSISKQDGSLLQLFQWASGPDANGHMLAKKISDATLWDVTDVGKLLAKNHFNLSLSDFKNEIKLTTIQKAISVVGKVGMTVDQLFTWAQPLEKFWTSHAVAEDIQKATRAKFALSDWETAVKSLNDTLRKSQSDALVNYLINRPELVAQNVVDADSLFEFFLIDVQMGACMETSRMKQATSSVQLFIQRCLLGLEDTGDDLGVALNALDRDRWNWMQKYRVWEANRKVFLYPENWIDPSLRDDKSPIYLQLESALMQKDINTQTATDALKAYLFDLDSVSNLQVVALYVQDDVIAVDSGLGTTSVKKNIIHVFARSRQSPYFFYYRTYDIQSQNWGPWQLMQVDIPNYDLVRDDKILDNGTYLVPFTFNGRIMVGIPQLTKKTAVAPVSGGTWDSAKTANMNSSSPSDYWEIKMGHSELRNNKWTQKVMTTTAVVEAPLPNPLPDVDQFQFVPRIFSDIGAEKVCIDLIRQKNTIPTGTVPLGRFTFTGAHFATDGTLPPVPSPDLRFPSFGYMTFGAGPDPSHLTIIRRITSLQADGAGSLTFFDSNPLVDYPANQTDVSSQIVYGSNTDPQPFNHQFTHQMLSRLSNADNLDALFGYFQTLTDQKIKDDLYGQDLVAVYSELKRPFSLYNWELGFHAPMALANSYLATQQFDMALKMCQYVFDPYAKGSDEKRYWRWNPFKEVDSIDSMEKLFSTLRPNTADDPAGQINQWRDNPFQPHVIARLRPVAYMKWVTMTYIRILIAYGDYYFKQNTLEMIPLAIQCYILASHVFGPRGQQIPMRGKKAVETYNTLVDNWDAFDNAMVQMELAFPFSNQTVQPIGLSDGVIGLPNIFGFATSRYFCIPDNPDLTALRDTIDDRLFKLRHCQDIFGVTQHLPLYEPPIDPGLLVAAAAQGLSLASVLNDLDAPMPNYRFPYLLQKAIELCNELKSLGNALLSAQEKQDGEALSLLRQQNEGVILARGMEYKKLALDEANKAADALAQSRKGPYYRMQHMLKLLPPGAGSIPDIGQDFKELDDPVPAPISDSGLNLIPTEKEEIDKAANAAQWQTDIGILETVASTLHVFPTVGAKAMPLGVGGDIVWGPSHLAYAVSAVARGMQVHASYLSFESSAASRYSSLLRTGQERVLTTNALGYDLQNIDKQILTQNIRIAMATHEIATQQQNMDNAQAVLDFLKNKYTNQQLYQWMQNGVSALFYQLYSMAHSWAQKAEKAYRLERGLETTNFVQFGYWENAYNGLMCGERLYMSLKQLEEAYNETRGYDFEVTKFVSLRQINPLSLLQLRDSASCTISVPEILFDMDFPGHYLRKIKSVAVTIPCVAGPYTTVNSTLRLTSHRYRTDTSGAASGADYIQKTNQDDGRFRTTDIPITAIAVSSGQNDSGVFELNFKDERLMPFESAGAISEWSFELADGFRQFDYNTITDIIMQIRYTSRDGGDQLKTAASDSVARYIKTVTEASQTDGLYTIFDVRAEYATAWYAAMNPKAIVTAGSAPAPPPPAAPRVLQLQGLNDRLPIYTKGHALNKILASDIMLVVDGALAPTAVSMTPSTGGDPHPFDDAHAKAFKNMKVFVAHELKWPIDAWTLTITDTTTMVNGLWIVVKYTLG